METISEVMSKSTDKRCRSIVAHYVYEEWGLRFEVLMRELLHGQIRLTLQSSRYMSRVFLSLSPSCPLSLSPSASFSLWTHWPLSGLNNAKVQRLALAVNRVTFVLRRGVPFCTYPHTSHPENFTRFRV